MFRVYIIHPSVNNKYPHPLLPSNPLLMPFMHQPNILQPNILLTLSIPNLYPLQTNLRLTFQINNPFNRAVLYKRVTYWVVDFVLMGLEVAVLFHYLAEDVSVG